MPAILFRVEVEDDVHGHREPRRKRRTVRRDVVREPIDEAQLPAGTWLEGATIGAVDDTHELEMRRR